MKKMGIVCMMVMCLALPGFASRQITMLGICLASSEQETERLREDLKNTVFLRDFMKQLLGSSSNEPEQRAEFKRRFGVSDEAMQASLMDSVRETSVKAGWKLRQQGDAQDIRIADHHLREAIRWLSTCAGAEGKGFLLGIATDNARDSDFRSGSISAYMRRANAQEKWDAIIRFLADDLRTAEVRLFFNVYHAAMQAYDEAEGDTQKREAIVVAASAALVKEEDKKAFAEADKLLSERSKEYAESPQRKAALERMNKPPEKETP